MNRLSIEVKNKKNTIIENVIVILGIEEYKLDEAYIIKGQFKTKNIQHL